MSSELIPILEPERDAVSSRPSNPRLRYLRFGAFHLDLQRQELFKDGSRLKLQGKAYQVLLTLLEKPGEVVTREELRQRLWPEDTHVNYDANVNTTVNKLRQTLGDSSNQPLYIETIPRKGYSFVAPVEYSDQPAAFPLRHPAYAAHAAIVPPSPDGTAAGTGPSFWRSLWRVERPGFWVTAGVVALVIAGMLLGAGIATLWLSRFMHPTAWH